ncbi:MAG: 23S rRNA (adenine(2503)-C(2))-methyltransferase RlmN [Candidatus Brocadia sp. WS118]|nr:MAG: 23S rRNA (adenine(2503)-C(2))-methyltransferase RlmN [Candidatus Brocadia sp. WS118]
MYKTEIQSITNMSLSELEALCTSMGEPIYRAKQMLSWIYDKGAAAFDQMSNLPKNFQRRCAEQCQVFQTSVGTITQTAYGTEKFLVHLHDGNVIESVLLREGKRVTACVSTQVGCAMACRFCASGLPGLERNLTTGEIVEQVLHMKKHLLPGERLTNVVFMGIGEPLANYDNVVRSMRIINAGWGLGIGVRHITVSTVGVVDGIRRLAHEGLKVNLAISLHASDDVTRSKILPINKKTGIKNLVAAAREYFKVTGRDVSFEYVLIDGVNASKQDAESLARLLKGIQCNINVLPVNPVEEFNWRPPSQGAIEIFCNILEKHGLVATIRKKKGSHINAACGQLRLQREKILWKKERYFVK